LEFSVTNRHLYTSAFSIIVVAILIFTQTSCTTYSLLTIENSEFKNIYGKVYVDPSLTEMEYSQILSNIEKAKTRIAEKFGGVTVDPIIIITGTPENASKYGLKVFPGSAHIAPWETYLVLDNDKIEGVDVISHELLHAQVAELTGYWIFTTKLPTWFSEGVAMQVDFRERYMVDLNTFDYSELHRVMKITSNSDFWPGNKEIEISNYRAAKAAVKKLLDEHEAGVLYERLKDLSTGQEFDEIFATIDSENTHNKNN